MQISNYTVSLVGATWVDVNSNFTLDGQPDLLPDVLAVNNSLYNLFHCPVGSRGRIFQPLYGSMWYEWIHEPIDQSTATKMEMATIQAIQRWEPRVKVSTTDSYIIPNYTLPGYDVRISYSLLLNRQTYAVAFNIKL